MELVHLHPLEFDLTSKASLGSLSSLELALVQLHLDTTPSLTHQARKLWHLRRLKAQQHEVEAYSSATEPSRTSSDGSARAGERQHSQHRQHPSFAPPLPAQHDRPTPSRRSLSPAIAELVDVLIAEARNGHQQPLVEDVRDEWIARTRLDEGTFRERAKQAEREGVVRRWTDRRSGQSWMKLGDQPLPSSSTPSPPTQTVPPPSKFHLADLDFPLPSSFDKLTSAQLLSLQFRTDFTANEVNGALGITIGEEIVEMLLKRATRDRGLGRSWTDPEDTIAKQQSEGDWRAPVYPGRSTVGHEGFGSPQEQRHRSPTTLHQRARTPIRHEERLLSTGRRRNDRSRSPPRCLSPFRSDQSRRPPSTTNSSSTSRQPLPLLGPPLHWELGGTPAPPPPSTLPPRPPPSLASESTDTSPADLIPLHVARSFFVLKVSGIPWFLRTNSSVLDRLPRQLDPDGVWRDSPPEQRRSGTTVVFFLFRNRNDAEDALEYINRPFRIECSNGSWALSAERETAILPLAMVNLRKDVRDQIKRELGWKAGEITGGGGGSGEHRMEERRRRQDDFAEGPPPLPIRSPRRPSLSSSISPPFAAQNSIPPSPPPASSYPNPRLRQDDDDSELILGDTTPSTTESPLLESDHTPITPVINDDDQDWPRAPALSDSED